MNRDKTYPVILRVTDIDVAYLVQARPMGTFQRRCRGWTSIAAAARLSCAGNGGDQPASGFDAPETMVFGIDEHDIVLAIDGDFFGSIEGGLQRRPMVASVASFSGPGNGSDDPCAHVHSTHLMIVPQTNVEVPRWAKCQCARS
jgi:hypothetical protein